MAVNINVCGEEMPPLAARRSEPAGFLVRREELSRWPDGSISVEDPPAVARRLEAEAFCRRCRFGEAKTIGGLAERIGQTSMTRSPMTASRGWP